ncbi:MAG: PilZ domain-containing protein [Fibrobacterota bacterium]
MKKGSRNFLRHPMNVPMKIIKEDHIDSDSHDLLDISHGGLAFYSDSPYAPGDIVNIEFPAVKENANIKGEIIWSRKVITVEGNTRYRNGLKFMGEKEHFHARMVEQACEIENYRMAREKANGRSLSRREAASEWIKKNAGHYPS